MYHSDHLLFTLGIPSPSLSPAIAAQHLVTHHEYRQWPHDGPMCRPCDTEQDPVAADVSDVFMIVIT